jgi:hypothetical protein
VTDETGMGSAVSPETIRNTLISRWRLFDI